MRRFVVERRRHVCRVDAYLNSAASPFIPNMKVYGICDLSAEMIGHQASDWLTVIVQRLLVINCKISPQTVLLSSQTNGNGHFI